MLPLHLAGPPGRPLCVLALGAHPDDIEIGAGGTLLGLAAGQPGLAVRYLVLTGTPARQDEARQAATLFLPGTELSTEFHDLAEGLLPARWGEVKAILEQAARSCSPDLILALFVAPVLLDASYDASLRDLRKNWLPVSSLVLVAVGLTAVAVAVTARLIFPEMP